MTTASPSLSFVSVEAERAVLRTAVMQPGLRPKMPLNPTLYFYPTHARLAEIISGLKGQANAVSVLGKARFDDAMTLLPMPGGQPLDTYLGALFALPALKSDEAEAYASELKSMAFRRRIQAISIAALDASKSPDLPKALGQLKTALTDVSTGIAKRAPTAGETADRLIDEDTKFLCASTGLEDLDKFLGATFVHEGVTTNIVGGYPLNRLVYVAGRPGFGKTSLLVLGYVAALAAGRRSGYYSLELVDLIMTERVLSCIADRILGVKSIHPLRIRHKALTDVEKKAVSEARDWLKAKGDAAIITHECLTVEDIDLHATANGIEFIVGDYLQRFASMAKSGRDQYQRAASVSSDFQIMAVQSSYPRAVVVGTQISRTGANKPPTLETLAESGSQEQHAAIVMALDREEMRDPATMRKHIADVRVLKNTDGKTGDVSFFWDGDAMTLRKLQVTTITL